MKHVRPFDLDAIKPGEGLEIVSLAEGLDCAIVIRRGAGGSADIKTSDAERFALMLAGSAVLKVDGESKSAVAGDLIFIPAGAEGQIEGNSDAVWGEIEAPVPGTASLTSEPTVIKVDPSRFEGAGFAYQSLIERAQGAATMRMNVLQVQPGAGSPDYHIHAFAQIYFILEGAMTIDIGRKRIVAAAHSVVVLPPGVVHRNFNASPAIERHVSLLVPEPKPDEIFDFAVTIHDEEAELLTAIPA